MTDADWVGLGAQDLWSTSDFSCAHILPCKKYTLDQEIFSQTRKKWKCYNVLHMISWAPVYLLYFDNVKTDTFYSRFAKHLNNLGPLQISTTELLTKIVRNIYLLPLTMLTKTSILDTWLSPECTSRSEYNIAIKFSAEISPLHPIKMAWF